MRKQQYNKILKHYSKIELVDMVYELGYSFDYRCELYEYSPSERILDYAVSHAHDVATANNNLDELLKCSKEYLYSNMIDLITTNNDIVDY
jgi:hypothetical protein|nr:MAG TPA: hypothetical protein [Caudoviricetes sp.]